jgi:hypothetical protein
MPSDLDAERGAGKILDDLFFAQKKSLALSFGS